MSSSHKSDRYNLPQFPGGAIDNGDIVLDQDYTDSNLPVASRYEDGLTIMTKAEGDVVVTHLNGAQITYSSVPAFTIIPSRVRSVDTGTTAEVVAYV